MTSRFVETRAALKAIAEKAGITDTEPRDNSVKKLESATTWFLSDLRARQLRAIDEQGLMSQKRLSPSDRNLMSARIEQQANRLLKALGLKDMDSPEDGMPPGEYRDRFEYLLGGYNGPEGERELRHTVAGIGKIRDVAKADQLAAAEEMAAEQKDTGGHGRDEALDTYIDELIGVYKEAGKTPNFSRHKTGEATGSTIRFIVACLEWADAHFIRPDPSLNAYRKIRYLTAEAIAHRIRAFRYRIRSITP